jgi:hypothetical protein
MSFLTNIHSVSVYESKLLLRSWFFRIFSVLLLLYAFFINGIMYMVSNFSWAVTAIPSNAAYINMLVINFAESIIAVFLASDFLKRDNRLDTSEVFYVHRLSNAEYVIGKIWGNLIVFAGLNIALLMMAVIFAFSSNKVELDFFSYIEYFSLINIPTLVFITGLSVFTMFIFKNQAVTFVVLLAYIGLTVFYLKGKCFFMFDYMAYALPMMKSQIIGFARTDMIIIHRSIYFFAGIGFIFIAITLFQRLPNSRRSNYQWTALAVISWLLSIGSGVKYSYTIINEGKMRKIYTEINNRYANSPKIVVEDYNISLRQHKLTFSAEATMTGTALETSKVFTFCLNPGLAIDSIKSIDGKTLHFTREHQIISVNFGNEKLEGEPVSLTINYSGRIDETFCYLDIPEDILNKYSTIVGPFITCGKQYSFQYPEYLLLTPESCWYPRPGTTFSSESPNWQQTYFSWFNLTVKPLDGLTPVSQGEITEPGDNSEWNFLPESPLQNITLAIGPYKHSKITSEGIEFGVWHFEGHDYYSSTFDSISDRIPGILLEELEEVERRYRLNYPFNRFNIVETPAQFKSYPHTWTQAQETMQPEMALMHEKAWSVTEFDLANTKNNIKQWNRRDRQTSEREIQERLFRIITDKFINTKNIYHIYPELFNFRFNIYSSKWAIANRIFELYLQQQENNNPHEFFNNEIRGINNTETANLLLEKHSFLDLLGNAKYHNMLNAITMQKTLQLFSEAETNTGTDTFRNQCLNIIKSREFTNIKFEELLDTLSTFSRTDIYAETGKWNTPTPLPYYNILEPKITIITNKGAETTIITNTIQNMSTVDGTIQLNIQEGDNSTVTNRKIPIQAGECKKIVTMLEDIPKQISINTLVSRNLPAEYTFTPGNIIREQRTITEPEGDYTIQPPPETTPGTIIVDNENQHLFSTTQKNIQGILPKLLHHQEEPGFNYKDIFPWFPVHQWTPTINNRFYGQNIHSAMVLFSGNGTQTATWKIPVPETGNYNIYYHFPLYQPVNNKRGRRNKNNNPNGELPITINHNNIQEKTYLNLTQTGWLKLPDNYYLDCDTITITISDAKQNNEENFLIIADAIKLEKKK